MSNEELRLLRYNSYLVNKVHRLTDENIKLKGKLLESQKNESINKMSIWQIIKHKLIYYGI